MHSKSLEFNQDPAMIDPILEKGKNAHWTKRLTVFHRMMVCLTTALSCAGGLGVVFLGPEKDNTKIVHRLTKNERPTFQLGAALENAEDHQETSDNRPWLIFHVGPSKTATTTIQRDLKCMNDFTPVLFQDGYKYLGHKTSKQQEAANVSNINWEMTNKKCLDEMVTRRSEYLAGELLQNDESNNDARRSLSIWPASLEDLPDCWQSIVSELHEHRQENQTSLIFSRESWSNSDREIWDQPGRFEALAARFVPWPVSRDGGSKSWWGIGAIPNGS